MSYASAERVAGWVLGCVLLTVGCAGRTVAVEPAAQGLELGAEQAHGLFTEILAAYVDEGRVDYERLCDDDRLEMYCARLAATDPDTVSSAAVRLAFWINAYNAYTLKVICDNYPVDSINDLHFGGLIVGTVLGQTVWDKKFAVVAGVPLSLNHIEHEIVRKRFDDPRAHFALVCASLSCPRLRSEAFEGERLDEQLDDQARIFFAEENKNRFDVESRTAHLSKILDWYEGDFGDNKTDALLYATRYLPDDLRASIESDPGSWKIEYTDYDWGLND